jgi:branched-chain amino acid transport system ATP-binding protein
VAAPFFEVVGLDAFYGKAQILFGLSLVVGRGEVVALMGRNGAGKSTTMKAIMGLVRERSGSVRLAGEELSRLAPHQIARRGLGWVPEDRRIFADLTVAENLEVGRAPARPDAPRWTAQALYSLFPNLQAMPDRLGGRMSGGEQQMLSVARTLMGNPRLLLLDEPSEGVAPVIVEQLARTIIALKREGLSVLLSEQNVAFARRVCDRAYLLDRGQLRFEGTMDALMADDALRREHLGV